MDLPDAPIAQEGFFATHFFTVKNQEKSKDFYVRILGGKVVKAENPCYIKLANTWIILNSGGGPTPDKPQVLLETPSDLNRVNSFLNLRVADIWACYKEWGEKGAFFLTEPLENHGWEWRCYMRDPDGYLIEVGQYTRMALERIQKLRGLIAKQAACLWPRIPFYNLVQPCLWLPARSSVHMKYCLPSGQAGWAKSTARGTRASNARWRSKFCRLIFLPIPRASCDSNGKPKSFPG